MGSHNTSRVVEDGDLGTGEGASAEGACRTSQPREGAWFSPSVDYPGHRAPTAPAPNLSTEQPELGYPEAGRAGPRNEKGRNDTGPPGHTLVTSHHWPGSDMKLMTWLSGYELCMVRPVSLSQLWGIYESQWAQSFLRGTSEDTLIDQTLGISLGKGVAFNLEPELLNA